MLERDISEQMVTILSFKCYIAHEVKYRCKLFKCKWLSE